MRSETSRRQHCPIRSCSRLCCTRSRRSKRRRARWPNPAVTDFQQAPLALSSWKPSLLLCLLFFRSFSIPSDRVFIPFVFTSFRRDYTRLDTHTVTQIAYTPSLPLDTITRFADIRDAKRDAKQVEASCSLRPISRPPHLDPHHHKAPRHCDLPFPPASTLSLVVPSFFYSFPRF